jgi:Na+-transporting NADH:ubiquinone oxidoreductase subunit NqrF
MVVTPLLVSEKSYLPLYYTQREKKKNIYCYSMRKLQWNENNDFYHNVIAALVVNEVLDNDSRRHLLQKVIKVFDLQLPVESDDIGDGG